MLVFIVLALTFYFGYLFLELPEEMSEQEYREYFKHNIMGMK